MNPSPTHLYRQRSGVVARRLGEAWVLVPVDAAVGDMGEVFTLNDVGAVLWERLAEGVTLDLAAAAVVEEFDTDLDTAREDAEAFFTLLLSAGLAERVAEGETV